MTITDKINLAIVIATLIAAAVALYVGMRSARAAEASVRVISAQTRELTRPRIVIWPWVRTGTQLLCLTVKNAGGSSALRVRLELDQECRVLLDHQTPKSLGSLSAFSTELHGLPPSAEMVFILGITNRIFATTDKPRLMPLLFSIKATYSSEHEQYVEWTAIDLNPYAGAIVPHHPVADAVSEVASEVRRLRDQPSEFARKRWGPVDPAAFGE